MQALVLGKPLKQSSSRARRLLQAAAGAVAVRPESRVSTSTSSPFLSGSSLVCKRRLSGRSFWLYEALQQHQRQERHDVQHSSSPLVWVDLRNRRNGRQTFSTTATTFTSSNPSSSYSSSFLQAATNLEGGDTFGEEEEREGPSKDLLPSSSSSPFWLSNDNTNKKKRIEIPAVKDWVARQKRLSLRKEIGSFEIQDWNEACSLLETYSSLPRKGFSSSSGKLEDGFALLDRLAHEKKEVRTTRSTTLVDKKDELESLFPMKIGFLGHVLTEWRRACLAKFQAELAQQLFPPAVVLDKVQTYILELGLFPPDPLPYGTILHVMAQTQEASELERMFRRMQAPFSSSSKDDESGGKEAISTTTGDDDSSNNNSTINKSDPRTMRQELMKHDGWSYLIVISAWRRAGNPLQCEALVRELADKLQQGHISPSLMDAQTLNLAIAAWSEAAALSSGRSKRDKDKQPSGEQDSSSSSTSMVVTMEEAAQRATAVFDELKHLLPPDLISYHTLMKLWSQCGRPDRVERIFQELQEQYESNNGGAGKVTLKPDYEIYRLRLQAWANTSSTARRNSSSTTMRGMNASKHSANLNHPEKATQVLREMIQLPVFGLRIEQQPCKADFDLVLTAWARSKHVTAGTQAEQVLQDMLQVHSEQWFQTNCRPDAVSYNNVLAAHVKSGAPGSSERAYQLFLELKRQNQLYRQQNQREQEQLQDKDDDNGGNSNDKNQEKQEDYGNYVKLDTAIYTTVLRALVRSRDPAALERAEEIFSELWQQKQLQQQNDNDSNDRITLDGVLYQVMIEVALLRKDPQRLEELYQEMQHGYEQGNPVLEPLHQCHVFRVRAWVAAGNPEMAVTAMNDWIQAAAVSSNGAVRNPRIQDFNETLHAWVRCTRDRPDAPLQAEKALRQMWEYGKSTQGRLDCTPNAYSYTNVISALAKFASCHAQSTVVKAPGWEALRLFRELQALADPNQEQQHEQHRASREGNFQHIASFRFQPSIVTYFEVIAALCRSKNDPKTREITTADNSSENNPSSSGRDVEDEIATLLDEMSHISNPRLFWRSKPSHDMGRTLDRMANEIQRSPYLKKKKQKVLVQQVVDLQTNVMEVLANTTQTPAHMPQN